MTNIASHSSFIDDLLLNRQLLIVTGKGGIGKTVIACALAKRARTLGRRVLVVEQSSVEQIGPLLGIPNVVHEETWIDGLGAANFTAGGNFSDFITKHLMKSSLLDIVVKNKVVHSFFTAIPGFSELMLLGRIYYAMNLAPKDRPDLIIMDAYASGHFLSLMTTPEAVLNSGLAGPILHQTTKVRDWLADKTKCGTVYVAVPEELVVSETLEFLPILVAKSPVSIDALIMNRCLSSSSGLDPSSPAYVFSSDGAAKQASALSHCAKSLSGFHGIKNLKMMLIPELGSIPEPLDEKTVSDLFGGVS